MRAGLTLTIAILALIFCLVYQRSQQSVVV